MTVMEALAARIPRVRVPQWPAGVYVRLPLLPGGSSGPWAELYDEPSQLALGVVPGSQRLLMVGTLLIGDVEPYAGHVSRFERDLSNLSNLYEER